MYLSENPTKTFLLETSKIFLKPTSTVGPSSRKEPSLIILCIALILSLCIIFFKGIYYHVVVFNFSLPIFFLIFKLVSRRKGKKQVTLKNSCFIAFLWQKKKRKENRTRDLTIVLRDFVMISLAFSRVWHLNHYNIN